MKKLTLLLALFFAFQLSNGQQNVLIIQPGPGLNDGTDNGTPDAGKDTWVNRFAPGDNYGDSYASASSPRSNCNTSDYKSYFRFDVFSLPDEVDSVFFGVTHLPHTTYCYANCDADFYFYHLTEPWDEMALIQSNLPSEDPTPFYGPINITFPNDFGNREYNITDAYNYWKSPEGNNFGFVTYSPTVGCNNAAVTFSVYSSDEAEETFRPYLKIYYGGPTGVNDAAERDAVTVYPNPFKDQLIFDAAEFDRYYLTDLYGKVVDVTYDEGLGGFHTDQLSTGLYILHLEKGSETHTVKVIKGE
ncbi:DNRLRE domain-containing protein [Cryomorphaceae bacterium 1068]|nr:DNRLRE domain-containing protein [Cryomorphaceae bacterium 1068]